MATPTSIFGQKDLSHDVYFLDNSRNRSGIFVQFSKMCFLKQKWPRDQVKHIIRQFNYAHHLTKPFCDDIQQQKIIDGPLSGHRGPTFRSNIVIFHKKSHF